MPTELPDKLTPASKEQAIEALWKAWLGYFGSAPKKESIWILVAQWGLETGFGRACHNWNFGNVKSHDGDGYDFQCFGCGEEIPLAMANAWKAKDPTLVIFKRTYDLGGKPMVSVWVNPPHPASRFRAFETILEGATDYIALLVKRFTVAWPSVEAGDPVAFSHGLKQQGYYTADVNAYTATMVSTFNAISKLAFDYDSLPALTDDEKNRIGDIVGMALYESIGESLAADNVIPPDSTT